CMLKDGDDITAQIKTDGGALDIDIHNAKLTQGDYTAVAFGHNMTDLEVYVFELRESQVLGRTGYTTGYD
ncbi:hypothetical protein PMAYCL1PPCAC_16063, partial [Pristionchus mayeri]